MFHNSYHMSHTMYCDIGRYCVSHCAVLPVCITVHQSIGVSFQSYQIACCIKTYFYYTSCSHIYVPIEHVLLYQFFSYMLPLNMFYCASFYINRNFLESAVFTSTQFDQECENKPTSKIIRVSIICP